MVGLHVFWCELENRVAEAEGGEMGLGPSVTGPEGCDKKSGIVFFFSGMGNHGMVLRRRVTQLDLCIRSSFWQPNGRRRGVVEERGGEWN